MIYILHHDAYYIAQFAKAVHSAIKNDFDCKLSTENIIDIKENDIFILLNCFGFNNNGQRNIHIIIINYDIFDCHKHFDCMTSMANYSDNETYILDYQSPNIKFFNENNKNPKIKILYLPLTINPYFKNIYENDSSIVDKKDIDVLLFCGSMNARRQRIIDELKNKYVTINVCNTYEGLIPFIKRSKIVLDVYYFDNNKAFDFYRLVFLLSGGIFFITETPSDIDPTIEPQLINYSENIIHADYENLVTTVDIYLQKSQTERDELGKKAMKWFENIFNYSETLAFLLEKIQN